MEFKLNHTVAGKLQEIADLLEQQGEKCFHTAWVSSGREHTRWYCQLKLKSPGFRLLKALPSTDNQEVTAQ